jgi:hypothetical protein
VIELIKWSIRILYSLKRNWIMRKEKDPYGVVDDALDDLFLRTSCCILSIVRP